MRNRFTVQFPRHQSEKLISAIPRPFPLLGNIQHSLFLHNCIPSLLFSLFFLVFLPNGISPFSFRAESCLQACVTGFPTHLPSLSIPPSRPLPASILPSRRRTNALFLHVQPFHGQKSLLSHPWNFTFSSREMPLL